MSIANTIRERKRQTGSLAESGPSWLWPAIFLSLLGSFLVGLSLYPGALEGKSLAVLHGLCAQQPTHSIYFGDQRLPFDARMTGIYGGAAVTAVYLLAIGRWRVGGVPPGRLLLLIGLGIVALGFDGVNSTLADVGFWHLYPPSNALRLATGLLTGLAITTFIWMLYGQMGFQPDQRRQQEPVWKSFIDITGIYGALAAFGLLVLARVDLLRIPLTYLLILSAVLVLTGLLSMFVILLLRAENRARSLAELAPYLTGGLLAAFLLMGVLAGGRFLLEIWAGVQTTT